MKYNNILVIEESNSNSKERIISSLTKAGFKLVIARSCEEVLSKLDELNINLIVLGEGLPVDSFEVCSQLRQAVNVPILMVGVLPNHKAWLKAVEVGADCYLLKPFSCLELVARVKAILRRYEQSNKNLLTAGHGFVTFLK